jgi:hypothetical protein
MNNVVCEQFPLNRIRHDAELSAAAGRERVQFASTSSKGIDDFGSASPNPTGPLR